MLTTFAATGNLMLPVGPALTGVAAADASAAGALAPAGAQQAAAVAAPTTAAAGQTFTDCYSPTLYHLPDGTCVCD